jgi:hypothetical protein
MAAIRAESAAASAAAARAPSESWDVEAVSERLVRAGVAPRRIDPAPEAPEFLAHTITAAFALGRDGELRVFIFPDSGARRRVTGRFDPVTATPRGADFHWPRTPLLIVQQNLAAIMMGGTEALRERVQLALEAGLPPPR